MSWNSTATYKDYSDLCYAICLIWTQITIKVKPNLLLLVLSYKVENAPRNNGSIETIAMMQLLATIIRGFNLYYYNCILITNDRN